MKPSIIVTQHGHPDQSEEDRKANGPRFVYIVKEAKNQTVNYIGQRLSKNDLNELIETCGVDVTIRAPKET